MCIRDRSAEYVCKRNETYWEKFNERVDKCSEVDGKYEIFEINEGVDVAKLKSESRSVISYFETQRRRTLCDCTLFQPKKLPVFAA